MVKEVEMLYAENLTKSKQLCAHINTYKQQREAAQTEVNYMCCTVVQ